MSNRESGILAKRARGGGARSKEKESDRMGEQRLREEGGSRVQSTREKGRETAQTTRAALSG